MPVKQRGGGWQADLSVGTRRWRYAFDTEGAATGWLADAQAAVANGRPVPEPDAAKHGPKGGALSFARACDLCWADVYAHVTSAWPKTAHLYMLQMQRFWPHETMQAVAQPGAVASYTRHLYATGGAQSTINGKLSVLQKVFTWAYAQRHVNAVPKVTRQKPNNMRLSYLSPDDETTIIRILIQCELRDAAEAVMLLIDTGLRPSELWRLQGTDVLTDAQRPRLVVRTSKNGLPRTVPCTTRAGEIVTRRVKMYGKERLFPTMTNRRLQLAWAKPKVTMERTSDKDFVPYICRHTCASRLVQKGVPLGVVMGWMGHKNIQVTMRYAKHASAEFDAAAAALDNLSNDALPVPGVVPFVPAA